MSCYRVVRPIAHMRYFSTSDSVLLIVFDRVLQDLPLGTIMLVSLLCDASFSLST